uniref:Uncharacterized protein n=1 Tax=Arundo donax TaxID=35708 RepID=A0A0A9FIN5_ARUDO
MRKTNDVQLLGLLIPQGGGPLVSRTAWPTWSV